MTTSAVYEDEMLPAEPGAAMPPVGNATADQLSATRSAVRAAKAPSPIADAAAATSPVVASGGGLTRAAPIQDNSTYLTRNFPSLTANSQATNDMMRSGTSLGDTMGRQVRGVASTIGDVGSDLAQPLFGIGAGIKGVASDFVNGLTGNSTPLPQAAAPAPNKPAATVAAPAASTPAPAAAPTGEPATIAAVAPQPNFNAAPTNQPGVLKVTGSGINSPIFTNGDPSVAAADYRNNAPNIMPASSPIAATANGINFGGGGGASADLAAARAAAADRGDFDAVRNSYQANGGTFNGETAAQTGQRETMQALQRAIQSATGRRKEGLLAQYAALVNAQNQGASTIAEAGLKAAQTKLTGAQTAAENLKTKLAANDAETLNKLQDQLVSEPDPDKRRAISEQILTLKGKDTKDAYQIAKGAPEPIDPNNPALGMKPSPDIVIDTRTGVGQLASDLAKSGKFGTPPPQQPKAFVEGQRYTDPVTGKTKTYRGGKFVD